MSVTQSQALPAIAFSRNPIPVILESDAYIETEGVNAVNLLTFEAGPLIAGATIALNWPNAPAITMTAAAEPDDSGTQFPPGVTTDEAYVQSLVEYFQSNYYLDQDFEIEEVAIEDQFCLQFTAKNSGIIYNMAANTVFPLALTNPTAGVDEVLQPNFANHLEVWLKTTGAFSKIYDNNLQLDFPITGVTTKDISEILNPYLSFPTASDKPSFTAITWQLCNNTAGQYYIKFAEYYGDTPVIRKLTQSAPAYVSCQGLATQAALNQTLTGYLYPGNANSNVLCLRQGSKLTVVQPTQPEFLYWINLTGAVMNIKLRIDIYCTDGTTTYFTFATAAAAAYQKYYIAVGYSALNLQAAAPTGKTIAYFTARVICSDDFSFQSALYTYVLDQYREFSRFFIYLNSLGGYQTLYTWGKAQPSTDRTKDDVVRQVTYPDQAVLGKSLEANIRIQDKATLNTGYTTSRAVLLLKDFLASPEKYLVDNGNMIPVGISSSNLKQPMDGDPLSAGQFEYYPLYDEYVYTDDADQPDNANNSGGFTGTPGGYNAVIDDDNNLSNPSYID